MTKSSIWKPFLVLVILTSATSLSGCSNKEEAKWAAAQEADSPQAYREFLELYPESQFAPEANNRIEQIMRPLSAIGLPTFKILDGPFFGAMTCWTEETPIVAYLITEDTFISDEVLRAHFRLHIGDARMWHPEGSVGNAGIRINENRERVIFGSMCMGSATSTILVTGPIVLKPGGLLFQKGARLAQSK